MTVFTRAWWEAAGSRAAYTALAALSGLVLLYLDGDVTIAYVLSFVAVAVLASLITSLAGIPEAADRTVPLWRAIVVRVLKTAAQVAVPAVGAVTLLEEITWRELGVQVAAAALTTLIRTLMSWLPETLPPAIIGELEVESAGLPGPADLPQVAAEVAYVVPDADPPGPDHRA